MTNKISNDEFKKGHYIFEWLKDIIVSIQAELNDPELTDDTEDQPESNSEKIVYLFEMSACAGSGFYSEGPSRPEEKIVSPYQEADYAVKISGRSMEPTVCDDSIVFVKKVDELQDGDIGIFVVDGNVMCKRFREEQGKQWLEPDNNSGEFTPIRLCESISCIVQGKVLLP